MANDKNNLYLVVILLVVLAGIYVMWDPSDIFSIVAPDEVLDGEEEVWDSSMHVHVQTDLTVETGGALIIEGARVSINPGVKIYVEDGAYLNISNGAKIMGYDIEGDGWDWGNAGGGVHFLPGAMGHIEDSTITEQNTCIFIEGGDYTDVGIMDNNIYTCRDANIYVEGMDIGEPTHLTIMYNTIKGTNFASSSCIRLEASSRNINIVENYIESCVVALQIGAHHDTNAVNHFNYYHNIHINNDQQVKITTTGEWGEITLNSVPETEIPNPGGDPDPIIVVSDISGNYWSNYHACVDSDGNGYCEDAYGSSNGLGDSIIDNAPRSASTTITPAEVIIKSISSPTSLSGQGNVVKTNESVTFIIWFNKGHITWPDASLTEIETDLIEIDVDGDLVYDISKTNPTIGQTWATNYIYDTADIYEVYARASGTYNGVRIKSEFKIGISHRTLTVVNAGPTAFIDYTVDFNGGLIQFDGGNSTSPNDDDLLADGNIDDYEWTITNQYGSRQLNGEIVTYTPSFPGQTFDVLLVVTDEIGLNDDVIDQVVFADQPPTAFVGATTSAIFDPVELEPVTSFYAVAGQQVTFVYIGEDPEGNEIRATWDLGDNTSTTEGPTVAHIYAARGQYTLTMEVMDASGNTDTATVLVTITDPIVVAGRVVGADTASEFFFGPMVLGIIVAAIVVWVLNREWKDTFELFNLYTIVVIAVIILSFILIDRYLIPIDFLGVEI